MEIKLPPIPESRSIVAEQKSLDSREKVAEPKVAQYDLDSLLNISNKVKEIAPVVVEAPMQRKTSAAQRKAIQKYESNFKRINCRLPLNLWHKIESTGISANSVIISALEEYLSE